MLSLLGLTSPPREKKLGDLDSKKNIGEQLFDLKGKMETTMDKNTMQLKKFRELSKFNETLSESYAANLKIIVDISNLLGAYNEFFEVIKNKLAEMDEELGIPISSNDFEHMKTLTNNQMVQLHDVFKNETSSLKKLYTKYGKQKEFDQLEKAEALFDKTHLQGVETMEKMQDGGKGKMKRKTKRGTRK